jgi:hypothetical protein
MTCGNFAKMSFAGVAVAYSRYGMEPTSASVESGPARNGIL